MKFISSVFSNLALNVRNGLTDGGINASFYSSNFYPRGGQLKFYSNKGYDNVFVYAAKRTMMQMSFATINDLYPKYLRQLDRKKMERRFGGVQKAVYEQLIKNGQKYDAEFHNDRGIVIKYRGKPANEGLLLWINDPKKQEQPTLEEVKNGAKMNMGNKNEKSKVNTYWDKIKGLSNEAAIKSQYGPSSFSSSTEIEVPGTNAFLDLGAIVQAQGANNLVLTKVQGRDFSRKELISREDMTFSVSGQIVSNYPDVYPYEEVSKFVTLMQHRGVIQVHNILFQQFNVSQILIKNFSMGQEKGFKNVQPYSFSCVAVEPNDEVKVLDTIEEMNIQIGKMDKKGWGTQLLDKIKKSAANQAAQMLEELTAKTI